MSRSKLSPSVAGIGESSIIQLESLNEYVA